MAARVTIADLAAQLGLSKASVSYALNGQPGVSDGTRQRVLALADELGWYPSFSAKALSSSRTGAIGLVLSRDPELLGTEPYYMRVMSGIESVLIDSDMALLLRMVGAEAGQDLAVYERWAGERRVDGVILFDQLEDDPRIPLVMRLGLPAVLHGTPVDGTPVACVSTAERVDGQNAVDHLVGLGHRRIAHVSGPLAYMHESLRRTIVRERCAELGVVVDVVDSDYTIDGGAAAVAGLLAAAEPPTAVLCANDLTAIGCLAAAHDAGLDVPGDLSVVSWDDSMFCRLAQPPITALDRDPRECGRLCAQLAMETIAGAEPVTVVAPPSVLMVRGTTGPAPSR